LSEANKKKKRKNISKQNNNLKKKNSELPIFNKVIFCGNFCVRKSENVKICEKTNQARKIVKTKIFLKTVCNFENV
jgi:hypothetical protein